MELIPSKRTPEPTRRQRWLPYVRSIADILALKDWRIEVADELPADEAHASIVPGYGRKCATLRLSDGFFKSSREEQRQTIVHELIHCHGGPFVRALQAKKFDDPVIILEMEYDNDALADAIAPLLPLPPKELRS